MWRARSRTRFDFFLCGTCSYSTSRSRVTGRNQFSWLIVLIEAVPFRGKAVNVHVQSVNQKVFLLILCVRDVILSPCHGLDEKSFRFMHVCELVNSEVGV